MLKLLGASALLSTIVYMCFESQKETYNYKPAPVTYLTEQQTRHLILTDFDNFGHTLNPANLKASGVESLQECLEKWASSSTAWTTPQKTKIAQAVEEVQIKLRTIPAFSKSFQDQMNGIEWNVAATIYPYYLQGLPHTRGDIIFLTDKLVSTYSVAQLADILLHEKTHVWQRKFPEKMQQWMKMHGFELVGPADNLERRNPDNDGQIYKNESDQQLGVRFTSAYPKDMTDVVYSEHLDHPYEQFASQVQERGRIV